MTHSMRSNGANGSGAPRALAPGAPRPIFERSPAEATLRAALQRDREGATAEAIAGFTAAVEMAEESGEDAVFAEALRRLAVVRHRSGDTAPARELCQRSFDIATRRLADARLGAEALNALASFDLEAGAIESAEETYRRALVLARDIAAVRVAIEQNLGILANIRGNYTDALAHYHRALEAAQGGDDQRSCAVIYHNLGMISADRHRWDEADSYFRQSRRIAEEVKDAHLRGLCLLNHAEVHVARGRMEQALRYAEGALTAFDELHAHLDKADAYKVIGVVFREVGRTALAEARLKTAVELAASTGGVLSEAEATRELAILSQSTGRNQDALRLLSASHKLFRRLDARADLVDVASKMDRLEATYLAVVREWGRSIESADTYTHGHCERVADYGAAVAGALGLDDGVVTTIRLGAYLHDLGKVRIPHEILNKPGRLTDVEFGVMKKHPEWGLELVADIEFPWDIKPIIRSHHEKYDGSGYPDGLVGDAIPLGAQVICVVDVYDALTTTRSYRAAMSKEEALGRMRESGHWWRPDVFAAFERAIGHPGADGQRQGAAA
ncbi:MAG TPA: HD domain-containing phosphohydrolase [Gemmatimonadales bacterium]|nr:HD domain-containing phosphohydrolase [Gemmatimonadales bacterium]